MTPLGGLMARNGDSNSENYVFNVVGTRFDIPSIETKSTTNKSSGTIEHFGISTTRAELRMTREGSIFNMYSQNIGDTIWIHRSVFNRIDLPDTLQVGVIAYAFESYPEDLLVKFDYVKFSEFSKMNYPEAEPRGITSLNAMLLNVFRRRASGYFLRINKWMGGDGMWNNPNMWSLNAVPDSTQSVVIDNPQIQTIQMLQNEDFKCFNLEIIGGLTELVIDGQFSLKAKDTDCD